MRRLIILFLILKFSIFAFSYNNNIENFLLEFNAGNLDLAIASLKRGVATNNILAQFYMAQCLEYGLGVNKNEPEAFSMYRRAAERGYAPAMAELSRCYTKGIGIEVNPTKAREWENRYNLKDKGERPIDLLKLKISEKPKPSEERSNPTVSINKTISSKNKETESEKKNNESDNFNLNELPQKKILIGSTMEKTHKSDVDVDIPVNNAIKDNVFVLIIANENYHDVANVPNALNDGEIFSKYCNLTLGVSSTNIHLLKDGTLGNIKREISWIQKISDAYNGDASFWIFYAGHGIPDEKTKEAYILPIDGFPGDLSTCLSLNELYDVLGTIKSKMNVLFLDACFSGSTRGDEMLSDARGIAIKSNLSEPKGNTIVLSSSLGDESSFSYIQENHGMFTYFLLKKIKESKGNVSLNDLFSYIKDNVSKKSIVLNGKSQTPTITPSKDILNEWKNWKLN